ncbi:MAG: exopolysaccharide biosynthesis protein [Tepidisphaeraceae bacterium]
MSTDRPQPCAGGKPLSLAGEFERLLLCADGRSMTVAQTLEILKDRGPAMVILLMSIPCVVPFLAVGLAVPVGIAVAMFGAQVAFQFRPWLPRFLARRELSFAFLQRLVQFVLQWGRPVEHLLRPRLGFMLHPAAHVVTGLTLSLLGIVLALPLVIPFSNEIPALAIVILLLGWVERDGIFVLVGEFLSLAILTACGYVGYLFWIHGFKDGFHIVREHLHLAHPTSQPH